MYYWAALAAAQAPVSGGCAAETAVPWPCAVRVPVLWWSRLEASAVLAAGLSFVSHRLPSVSKLSPPNELGSIFSLP